MLSEETQKDNNCFMLVIICHTDVNGKKFLDKDRKECWHMDDMVCDLSEVETLSGKPKIMVIEGCRGSKCVIRYNNTLWLVKVTYVVHIYTVLVTFLAVGGDSTHIQLPYTVINM